MLARWLQKIDGCLRQGGKERSDKVFNGREVVEMKELFLSMREAKEDREMNKILAKKAAEELEPE